MTVCQVTKCSKKATRRIEWVHRKTGTPSCDGTIRYYCAACVTNIFEKRAISCKCTGYIEIKTNAAMDVVIEESPLPL